MTKQNQSVRISPFAHQAFTSYLYFFNKKNKGKKKFMKDLMDDFAKELGKKKIVE